MILNYKHNEEMKMKFSPKNLLLGAILVITFTGESLADSKEALPSSNQIEQVASETNQTDSADLPLTKLEVQNSDKNSKLEKGKGCADIKNLPEVKGETFVDYPEAKTVPCDKVDCSDLEPAKLYENNYKDLPEAKTDLACEEEE